MGVANSGPIFGYVVGVRQPFLSGLLACKLMIKLVKNTNLRWFAVYCGIMGLLQYLLNSFTMNRISLTTLVISAIILLTGCVQVTFLSLCH